MGSLRRAITVYMSFLNGSGLVRVLHQYSGRRSFFSSLDIGYCPEAPVGAIGSYVAKP